jgi:DNA-nicking Smr family endonuclease
MNKSKKNRTHVSGEFRNSPFKPLKGLTSRDSGVQARQLRHPSSIHADDGEELFRRAVLGVQRLDRSDENQIEEPASMFATNPSDRSLPPENNECALFLQSMSIIGADALPRQRQHDAEEKQSVARRSPSSRLRQLKHGSIRITQELDLHGSLREEAISRLKHFITNASAGGQQAVLVITGKGLNSQEGPVLRGAVAEWLSSRGRALVAEFHPAPREKGGSGAFVVFLKRRR